jgi:nitroreductase
MGATTSGQVESPRSLSTFSNGLERRGGGTTPDLPAGHYAAPLVDLDLVATLRSTGAARQFHPEPVGDDVLERLLDTARFAPSGGNRQGWRVIVVKDPERRAALRDIYLSGWYEYLALGSAGLVPWSPVADRGAEEAAIANAAQFAEAGAASPGFAETLDTAPALLLVLADLGALAAVDRDLPRYTLVGGASIYPFVWSLLLAARSEGLGGVMTSVAVRREDEVRALFGIPDTVAVAALVVLGRPVTAPRKLTRAPVEAFAWVDRYDGDRLGDS